MIMATTTILPVHPTMELGAAQTVKQTVDYVMNPAKTNGGILVTGYGCDPAVATEDFMSARDEYLFNTGRNQGANEILVYHVRQSFLPGEADLETVSRLGYELAMELTGGDFSFIVCTHTDKPHLHNHIIINAVNMDCDKKFRNELHSYKRIRRTADRISAENNLSVVENPKPSKGSTNRYRNPTKRDGFASLIDKIIDEKQPKDFDDFLKQLEFNGCKIKRRGSTISVRPPGAERFFRFRAGQKGLPDGYDEESLRRKIADMQAEVQVDTRDAFDSRADYITDDIHADAETQEDIFASETHADTPSFDDAFSVKDKKTTPVSDTPPSAGTPAEPTINISHDKKINRLIDIDNSIKAQTSLGYERWATGFNLQQAAETLLFLQTNNLTDMEALTQAAEQAKTEYDALQNRIDAADARIKQVNILQRHIGAYNKNRDVYSQYLRSKRSPKFRADNEKAIATAEEAKAYFDSLGLDKLPSIKELQAEYSILQQEKNSCYQARREMRQSVLDLQSAKKNVELLLGIEAKQDNERNKKKGQDSR
jgi:hypothetical protein